jgi:NTP pyrophosphatase (non-canonical NTP hydrolase)
MTLDYIQREVDDWIKSQGHGYWPQLDKLAHLTEEVGEVAREMSHLYGAKKKKSSE